MRVTFRYLTLLALVVSFVLPYTAITSSATPAQAANANGISVPTSSSIVAHVFRQSGTTGVNPNGPQLFQQTVNSLDFNPNSGVNPCTSGSYTGDQTNDRPMEIISPSPSENGACTTGDMSFLSGGTDPGNNVGGGKYYAGCGTALSNNSSNPCPGYTSDDQQLGDFAVEAVTTITVPAAGTYTLNFESDDGSYFGIGPASGTSNQPTLVSGTKNNLPATTLNQGLPVLGGNNNPQSPATNDYVVSFPAAGCYPLEIDYMEVDAASLELVMGNGTAGNPLQQMSLTTANTQNSYSENQTVTGATVATFTSPTDGGSNASNYTATASYSDGNATNNVQVVWDGTNNRYNVTADHTFPKEATTDTLSVTVNCICGSSFSAQGNDTITEPTSVAGSAGSVSPTEGQALGASTVWGTFTDSSDENASEWSVNGVAYSGISNPTTAPTWQIVKTGTGTYSVEGTGGVFPEEGTGTATISVSEDNGSSLTLNPTSVTVVDAPLDTAVGQTVDFGTGTSSGSVPLGMFKDENADCNNEETVPTQYTASINWGDGNTSSGTVAENGTSCQFTVSGSHEYIANGSYPITITVQDSGGSTTTISSTASASGGLLPVAQNQTFSVAEGGSTGSVTLGTFHDTSPNCSASNYSASITWGDGTTGTGAVSSSSAGPCDFDVTASHTYTEEGSGQIGVSIKDSVTNSAVTLGDSYSATDAALTATAGTPAFTGGVSGTQTVATFSDAAGSGNCDLADYSATITWGDGATSAGTIAATGACAYSVTGTHTYTNQGNYTIHTAISDRGGSIASADDAIVLGSSGPLAVTSTNNTLTTTEGAALTSQTLGTFTDANGDPAGDFTATVQWGDSTSSSGTITESGGTYTVKGTHTYTEEGSYPISVVVSTTSGAATQGTISLSDTGSVADAALTLTAGTPAFTGGVSGTQTVATFTDGAGSGNCDIADLSATITWGDGSTSTGTIASTGTCAYSVTGTHTYTGQGNYTVHTSVSDRGGSSASTDDAVTIGASGPLSVASDNNTFTPAEGASTGTVTLGTFGDSNTADTVGDFTATVQWGDGTSTAGTISGSAGSFTLKGSHTYTEEGSYPISAVVTTTSGAATQGTITLTDTGSVADASITGSGTAVAGQTEGVALSGVQVASFTDAAGSGNCASADYSATINWGDGGTSTGTVGGSGCSPTVSGGHTYAEEGTYTVTTTFSDRGGASATATTSIVVSDGATLTATSNIGPLPIATEGQQLAAGTIVGSFTDSYAADNQADYSALITVTGPGCTVTIAGSVQPAQNGVYAVTTASNIDACALTEDGTTTTSYSFTVNDKGGGSATSSTSYFNVEDAPLTAVNGSSFTAQPNKAVGTSQVLGTFHDADGSCAVGDYTANVNWGDGSSSAGTVVASADSNACDFDVTGGHTYTKPGTYTVTVTASDAGGSTTQVAATVLVSAGLQPITQGQTFQVTEGGTLAAGTALATFQDANPNCNLANYTATIDWGDGSSTSAGTIVADSVCKYDVRVPIGGHTYAEEGTGQIKITVKDSVTGDSLVLTDSYSAADAALNGSGLTGSGTATEGIAVTNGTVGTFTDLNPTCDAGDFTATIAWGDGSSSNGTVTASGTGPCQFTVTGTHTYAEEGTYQAQTTVSDAGGSTTSGTLTVTVSDAGLSDVTDTLGYVNLNNQTFAEGQNTGTVGLIVFHDADPNCAAGDYTVRINWGDNNNAPGGGGETGQVRQVAGQAPGACDWAVDASHTWSEAGTYPVQVRVADHGTEIDRTDTVTITDAPLIQVQPGSNSVSKDDPSSKELLGTFRDTNGLCNTESADGGSTEPLLHYTVSAVNFGDGGTDTTQTSIVPSKDGNTCDFDVLGTHVYTTATNNGTPYTTSVTVQDDASDSNEGATVTVAGSTNVSVSDNPITLVTGSLQQNGVEGNALATTGTVVLGTFHDPDICTTNDYVGTVNWGDGNTDKTTDANSPVSIVASADGQKCDFDVIGNHTYAETGSYSISITVLDPNGSTNTGPSLTIPGTAVVADGALTPSPYGAILAFEGVSLSATNSGPQPLGTFTDANANAPVSDFTATVAWGDGSTSTGTVAAGATAGTFTVTGDHTYAEEDNNGQRYPVHVVIKDVDGSTTTIDDTANVFDQQIAEVATQNFPTGSGNAIVEGQAFSSQYLGTFHDPDPNCTASDYNVSINWGDGNTQTDLSNSTGAIALSTDGNACDFDVFGSHTYTEGGSYTVSVVAADAGQAQSDGVGVNDTASWADTATISDAPITSAPAGTIQGVEGSSNLALGQFTDTAGTCPDGGDYTVSVNWGDGTAATTGKVTQTGAGSCVFNVSGTHTYSDEGSKPYHIVATITDTEGSTAVIEDYATIVDAPLVPARHDFTQTEGQAFSNQNLGSFTDGNALCEQETSQGGTTAETDATHYTVTVDWGDNTAIDTNAKLVANGCTFTVEGNHTYAEERAGGYNVVVTVKDEGGAQTTITDTATVADAALVPSQGVTLTGTNAGTESQGQTFTLGTFQDTAFTDATHTYCDPADYTVTIEWGDGSSSAATVANGYLTDNSSKGGTCDWQIAAPHTYTTENNTNFPVHVVIQDAGGSQAVIDDQINVGDAALQTMASQNFSSVEGGAIASQFLGTFNDTDPNCVPGDYSISINWGDGSQNTTGTWAASTHNAGSCNFDAYGGHTYAEEGTYTVTVTVTDQSQSTTITDTATVADASLGSVKAGTFTQIEGANSPAPGQFLGTFSDAAGTGYCGAGDQSNQNHVAEYTVAINWGDKSGTDATTGFIIPSSDGQACDFDVYGSHIYNEEGTYTTSFTVTDHASQATVTSINGVANVTVNDAALTQVANPTLNQVEGQQFGPILTATFHDTAGDTVGAGDCPISDFTATINWGDGTTPDAVTPTSSPGSITASTDGNACDFNVNGQHIYPEEGSYTATITVKDEGGATVVIKDVVVVADASMAQSNQPSVTFSTPVEAAAFTGQYLGSFQDTAFTAPPKVTTLQSFCDSADYSLSINWGDGTGADTSSGAIVKPSTHNGTNQPCVFDVTGGHTYQEEGSYNVVVTVTDKGGATASITATAVVGDAALTTVSQSITFTPVEGNADTNQLLGRFHDAANPYCAANDFNLAPGSISINWGDATGADTTSGYVTFLGNCDFNVYASHTYLDTRTGGYGVTVSVSDDGGSQTTLSDTANVSDAALAAAPAVTLTQTEGVQFTGAVVGTFADKVSGPACQVLSDYSASVDWGDGSAKDTTAGANVKIVTSGNGQTCNFDIQGTHTYTEENTSGYPVTITVTDADGSTTQVSGTIKVVDAALSAGSAVGFSASVGQAFAQRSLGTFTDADPGCAVNDYAATITWGDGTSTTASAANGTIATGTTACQFQVLGSHQYNGNGPYSYTITVTDAGATTTLNGTVTMNGAPLQAVQQNQPVSGTEGQAISSAYLGEFHDTNPACSLSSYSATVVWGTNGPSTTSTSANAGIIPATDGSCNFKVYGNGFTPSEEGTGTITVTVTSGTQTAILSDPMTVTDAQVSMSPATPGSSVEGQAFASMPLGTFMDANPGCQIGDYTVSVNWGDGHSDTSAGSNVAITKGNGCQFGVAGSHTYAVSNANGYSVTVTVTDKGGSSSSAVDTILVSDAALSVVHAATFTATEGSGFAGQNLGQFSDADPGCANATYTVTVDWGDGSTSTGATALSNGCTFNVTGGHTYTEENATGYPVKVTVADAGGQKTVINSTATVTDAALSVIQPNPVSITDGQPLTNQYLGTFHDADPNCDAGDYSAAITWGDSATSKGTVIVTKNTTGSCNFDVLGSHQYTQPINSSYTITVVVTDAGATAATMTDAATVGDSPLTAGQVPNFKAVEGQPFTKQLLGTFRDTASSCTLSSYSATVNWGDGSATDPANGTNAWIQPSADGNVCDFDILGNHTYTQEGTYTTSVQVQDTPGVTVTLTSQNDVTVSDAPLSSTETDFNGTEGVQSVNQVLGTFTDTDPGCKLSDFTVSIKWGDNPTNADTTSGQLKPHTGNPCQIDIVASHLFAEEGTFKNTVTVTDGGGATTSFTDSAFVADAQLTSTGTTFSAVEGQKGNDVLLGTFTDANPNCDTKDFSVSILWGDTHLADVTSGYFVQQSGCAFNVYGNHVFNEESTKGFPVAVTVTDAGGASTTISDTATVSDAPLTSTGVTKLTSVEGQAQNAITLGTFTDANPFCDIADMSAQVTWGDKTSATAGTITADGNCSFTVTGSHTYGEEGTYTMTVNVADAGGSTTSFAVPVTVTDAPFTTTANPFTATEGTSLAHQYLGTFVDTAGQLYCDTADYSLSVTWGDGSAADSTATFVPSTHTSGACAFDVYGSHTFKEEGSAGTQVTVTDKGGSSATWSDNVQIADAPLAGLSNLPTQNCWVLTNCGQPSTSPAASVGALSNVQTLNAVAKFQDGNSLCDQEGDAGTHYTATINWGDGGSSAGTVQEEGTTCVFDVLGSHMYASTGTYTVTATVTDEGKQTLATSTALETASTIVVGVPASTAPVATPAKSLIQFKSGTGYNMVAQLYEYKNIIFQGHMTLTDTNAGLSLNNCTISTASTYPCRLNVLAYSEKSSKSVTIFGWYKVGKTGATRYFRLDLHDAAPSIADQYTLLTTDATGHTIVTSTPPTAPNSSVTVVL